MTITQKEHYFAMYDGVLHSIGRFACRDDLHAHIDATDPDWSFTLNEQEALVWMSRLEEELNKPNVKGLTKYAVLKDGEFHFIGEFRSHETAETFATNYAFSDDWSYLANEEELSAWLNVLRTIFLNTSAETRKLA